MKNRASLLIFGFVLTALLVSSPVAWAHALGEGYLFVNVGQTSLTGSVDLMFSDVDLALDLDVDGDGRLSEDEILLGLEDIQDYVASRIAIGSREAPFPIRMTTHTIRSLPLGQYLALNFEADVEAVPDVLAVEYRLLFDVDPQHRGFLVVSGNAKTGIVDEGEDVSLIFSPDRSAQILDLTSLSLWSSFVTFLRHGIWHIWIGFDHILFLIALILPAVLRREGTAWLPVQDFRSAIWNVLKIVTLFTVAHTITLTLAALDLVNLPSRLVEAVIAASVVLAALNNVYPVFGERVGWVVFGFGLFHGFGFAGVLTHLVANASNIVGDLAGFNVGVEIGQLAIVAVVFPLCYLVRSSNLYRKQVLSLGSVVIALFALGWLIERVADLNFMPL